MRAFFRKADQFRRSATWLRTWRSHLRVVPGAPESLAPSSSQLGGVFLSVTVRASGSPRFAPLGPSEQRCEARSFIFVRPPNGVQETVVDSP